VDDLVRLLVEWERAERDDVALGTRLRPLAAPALSAYADALRTVGATQADGRTLVTLDHAIDSLRRAVLQTRREVDEDYFVAGALVLALQRGAAAVAGA
jgi:hypothetical protein